MIQQVSFLLEDSCDKQMHYPCEKERQDDQDEAQRLAGTRLGLLPLQFNRLASQVNRTDIQIPFRELSKRSKSIRDR
jgi:hypothetical protein